jgi:Flp pilus assembly protein TadG
MGMMKKFLRNEDGNYAMIFAIAAFPIFGAVGISVDYSNLSRLNYNLSDAVDSMCSVVSREYQAGKTDVDSKAAGENFFRANIDPAYAITATTAVTLPDDPANTSKRMVCKGEIKYYPLFAPVLAYLSGNDASDYVVVVQEASMQLRSLAEVALVLDNSGSMAFDNKGENTSDEEDTRMYLLQDASKKLVNKMIDFGTKIQTAKDPVKFSLVPFASMVNVGPQHANASWMDTLGVSPTHHENLDWGTPSPTNPTGYRSAGSNGSKLDQAGNPLTRFSIYNALGVQNSGNEKTDQCAVWKSGTTSTTNDFTNKCAVFKRIGSMTVSVPPVATTQNSAIYSWKGCVEARPNGLDLTDGDTGSAAGKFVPSFAPDHFNSSYHGNSSIGLGGINNWWPDYETRDYTAPTGYWNNNNTTQVAGSTFPPLATARARETNVAKYFAVKPYTANGSGGRASQWSYYVNPDSTTRNDASNIPVTGTFGGPNSGCTVNPITPLSASKATLTTAIEAMKPFGGTNAAEGLAWGWRTLTPAEPFSEGAPIARRDIDRVVILLTDGANQLLPVGGTDYSANKSYYSPYGMQGYKYTTTPGAVGTATASAAVSRVFSNVTVSSPAHTQAKYTAAINARMAAICANIKADKIIVMTVGLDLKASTPTTPSVDQAAIDALKSCAGESEKNKNPDGTKKKLFWNATSATLDETFDEIAEELSNLRFTQ